MARIDPDSFGFTIADIARMSRTLLEQRIASAGLGVTPGEARALLHIAAGKGERQTRIAERLGVEPMTACGFVDRLEKQDLVRRIPDPSDRRAKLVEATENATALIDALLVATAASREDALAGLSPEERETMMKALGRVRRNLQDRLAAQSAETSGK